MVLVNKTNQITKYPTEPSKNPSKTKTNGFFLNFRLITNFDMEITNIVSLQKNNILSLFEFMLKRPIFKAQIYNILSVISTLNNQCVFGFWKPKNIYVIEKYFTFWIEFLSKMYIRDEPR